MGCPTYPVFEGNGDNGRLDSVEWRHDFHASVATELSSNPKNGSEATAEKSSVRGWVNASGFCENWPHSHSMVNSIKFALELLRFFPVLYVHTNHDTTKPRD